MIRSIVAMAIVLGGLVLGPPVSAAPPRVQVNIAGVADLGFMDFVDVPVSYRCDPGVLDAQITWTWAQGEDTWTETFGSLTCDGTLQRTAYPMYDRSPGWSTATATLTGHRAGGTAVEVTRTQQVWLRPAVKVRPIWPVVLQGDGSLRVTLELRCRTVWDPASVTVDASQGSTTSQFHVDYLNSPVDPGFVCDGSPHRVPFTVPAPEVGHFTSGRVGLEVEFGADWNEHGGPYDYARWAGDVKVVRR
ncbi:hypothetical protein [Serinicoccus kebangsaanensis]|uniref:hypothetical protein n=1 Tax=Serinicoccus kebangsaanensis TaxID=2602069 RepID=UPI00124CC16B|nr:hypothetical protein [Serinicoccus kebangsaanensis]